MIALAAPPGQKRARPAVFGRALRFSSSSLPAFYIGAIGESTSKFRVVNFRRAHGSAQTRTPFTHRASDLPPRSLAQQSLQPETLEAMELDHEDPEEGTGRSRQRDHAPPR